MGRRMGARDAVGIAAAIVGLLAAGVAAAGAIIAVKFARRVVTPTAARDEDVRIAAVDLASGEVVLAASDESRMRGRYGFWFDHESGHARLGDVIGEDPRIVRRRIDGVDFGRFDRAARGRMNGWYHLGPWELGHDYENVVVETTLGPAPAWVVPAEGGSDRWVVQVHGRGAKRQEGLRAVEPALGRRLEHAAHVVPQRRRGARERGSPLRARRHGVGRRRRRDAVRGSSAAQRRIVLMGWSMGGAIVLQAVLRSAEVRERLVGVVLDSPGDRLGRHPAIPGRGARLPARARRRRVAAARRPVERWPHRPRSTDRRRRPRPGRARRRVRRADAAHAQRRRRLRADRRLTTARRAHGPTSSTFEVFEGARHTKLWNHDPERWTRPRARLARAERGRSRTARRARPRSSADRGRARGSGGDALAQLPLRAREHAPSCRAPAAARPPRRGRATAGSRRARRAPRRPSARRGPARGSTRSRGSSATRRVPSRAGARRRRSTSTKMNTGDWHSSTCSRRSGWSRVALGQLGQLVRELEQQLQAIAHAEREEVVAGLGESGGQGRGVHRFHSPTDGARHGPPDAERQRAGTSPRSAPVTIGHAHGAAPLGPRAVVVAHVLEAEQVREHEPGVARTLADAAVGDHVVAVLRGRPRRGRSRRARRAT